MTRTRFFVPLGSVAVVFSLAAVLSFGANLDSLQGGKADLKSAGPLAFGPEAILFVGDSVGASLFALDTADRTPSRGGSLDIKGINQKIAAALGTTPDQILVNDAAVNPISKNVYLSVSRGRGPDAVPVILRVDAAGKITELALDNIRHSKVSLPGPVAADTKDRRGNSLRMEAMTDLGYVDGNVLVAGLSNEEFSSNLRSIPFPFAQAAKGASIEIWHGSHGRFETNSPIRTFVPFEIGNQKSILAAYTCTPLVKIPVSDLKPGNKVKGVTIAELGSGNRPLDMITYKKGGKDFLLMANSSHGVMKIPANGLEKYDPITGPVPDTAGAAYETVASLKGILQLDKFDDNTALVLADNGGSLDLRTVPLP